MPTGKTGEGRGFSVVDGIAFVSLCIVISVIFYLIDKNYTEREIAQRYTECVAKAHAASKSADDCKPLMEKR